MRSLKMKEGRSGGDCVEASPWRLGMTALITCVRCLLRQFLCLWLVDLKLLEESKAERLACSVNMTKKQVERGVTSTYA